MKSFCRLTAELEEKILAAIRSGGYPHVAAAAFGVPPQRLHKWLRWGNGKRAKYRLFAEKVAQAQAVARLSAEMQTHQKDSRLWLRAGPGKETAQAEGWTSFVRPEKRGKKESVLASRAVLTMLRTLREVLAPFPEALEAVTQAMDSSPRDRGRP